uniref:C-type lectin domain-containing protein n=1 Tax=Stomoxys calcitrans TaxID=35570 RepID=A0A1I8P2S6_STOCA
MSVLMTSHSQSSSTSSSTSSSDSSSSNSENNTKNVFNNDSVNSFIVTPMPTTSASASESPAPASASAPALGSASPAASAIKVAAAPTLTKAAQKSSSSPSIKAGSADIPITIPTSSTLRDKRDTNFGLDQSEIARQNQITQQLLSSYLERRLFPNIGVTQKIPTIAEILPKVASPTTSTTTTTTSRPKSKSLRRPRPRGFSVSSSSLKRGSSSSSSSPRKTSSGSVSTRKTPNSLQELLKLRRKQNEKPNEEDYEEDAEQDADEDAEQDGDYESGETDEDDNANNRTINYGHRHQHHYHSYRDELDEEDEYRARSRYRPHHRYRHHHGYHRHHYDDDIDQDGQEALQSVESEQHDHYYKTKGDIFARDPSENEIDSDCPHCVDETQYMNKWTMPLLKLGEKRYYLGIFFKANWFKATQYCRYHGMHLASISSQEENDRLEKHIKDFGLGNEHFWISGTDLADEGNFFWMSTGRPITFTNWNAGEPNNFRYENGEEENCMELWNRDGKGLKWNDSPCSFETYFVCEVQP